MANVTMIEKNMEQVTKKQAVVRVLVKILVYAFLIIMALISGEIPKRHRFTRNKKEEEL